MEACGPGQAPGGGAEPGAGTLADCLRRVALGEQEAFDRVYAELSGPVYALAVRILRDPAQAEEVAQEVLVEVWRTASRFDPAAGSAKAWALTIAHRRAVDRVRSEQANAERQERAARETARVLPEQDVAETVEGRLERQRLRRCMEALTELQRESLTLAYYSGYTYREVAELVGAPLGTVKTRMRDGLSRLRDHFGTT